MANKYLPFELCATGPAEQPPQTRTALATLANDMKKLGVEYCHFGVGKSIQYVNANRL